MIYNFFKELFSSIKNNLVGILLIFLMGFVGNAFLFIKMKDDGGSLEILRKSGLIMVKKVGERNFKPIGDRHGLEVDDLVFIDNNSAATVRGYGKTQDLSGVLVFSVRKLGKSLTVGHILNSSEKNKNIQIEVAKDRDSEERLLSRRHFKNIDYSKYKYIERIHFMEKDIVIRDGLDKTRLSLSKVCDCYILSSSGVKYKVTTSPIVDVGVEVGTNKFSLVGLSGKKMDEASVTRYRIPNKKIFKENVIYLGENEKLVFPPERVQVYYGDRELDKNNVKLDTVGNGGGGEIRIIRKEYFPDYEENYQIKKKMTIVEWKERGAGIETNEEKYSVGLKRKENDRNYFIGYYYENGEIMVVDKGLHSYDLSKTGKHCFKAFPLQSNQKWSEDKGICYRLNLVRPQVNKLRKIILTYEKRSKIFSAILKDSKCNDGLYGVYQYDDLYLKNELSLNKIIDKKITIGKQKDYRYIIKVTCDGVTEKYRLMYPVAPFGELND